MAVPIGLGMLLAAAALLVIGLVVLLPALFRVRRRVRALQVTVTSLQEEGVTALALLRARRGETEALLEPWRHLLRWARHPLVTATLHWYRRRRRARRRS